MRLAGRLQGAIEILADVEARHRPIADALKDWGLSHRFAGSGDRAAVGNIVYDTLRWRASSAWCFGEESPRALVLATIARRWGMGGAGLAAALAEGAHGPEPLTATEAARLDAADVSGAPAHVRADVPEWLAGRLERAFAEAWVEEGQALAERPPLDVRANRLKADRAKVLKGLAHFGATETRWSPDGVRIAPTTGAGRHPNILTERGFSKGSFEVQDEGSQIAALMVGAKTGEQVLDFCAGSGGKTLALAAAMANGGQIFATDRDQGRLAPIFPRLRRAGTRNVQVRDARALLDDLHGRMDAVLLDVPCTGTGTWRRRPDAKWRLSERALNDRIAEQTRLLEAAVTFLKPGGRLVYVTCSLLPDENDDRVAAFLASAPEFAAVPAAEAIDAAGLDKGLAEAALATDYGILLSPRRTQTDGFYVAVMRRK